MSDKIDQAQLDVIVIGAGPAGGQCARDLAKAGLKVLLLEHSSEIGEPNYSTAGTPKETIEEFNLPPDILSATWDRIYFESKNAKAAWQYNEVRGYVFDFAALRKFLAEDAARAGADIMVGTGVTEFIEGDNGYVGVKYKGILGEGEARAKYIVDATGHWGLGNAKLHINEVKLEDIVSGIEVQESGMPEGFSKTLAFFVGSQAPQGYGWIFPMEYSESAKIGVGVVGELTAGLEIKTVFKNFLKKFENTKHLEPTEIHGGGGHISAGPKNHVFKNIILIGDAAFQANALAYEGIRHAMTAGRLTQSCISQAVKNNWNNDELKEYYEKSWSDLFSKRWYQSYAVSKMVYCKFDDDDWDKLVEGLGELTPTEAFDIFFNYKYELMLKIPKLVWLLSKHLVKDIF